MIGLLILGSVSAAWKLFNWSNYDTIAKRILFTATGTWLANPVLDTNSGGVIIAYGPLTDWSGNNYITGWYVSGVYLLISNSGDYFNANSWTYFLTNSWVYFETNSWTYFNTYSGDYFNANSGVYFEANSGTYFNTYSGDFFNANSWTYFETNSWTYFLLYSGDYFNANSWTYFNLYSGDYYTTNPLWYITGWQVPADLRQTSTVWWLTEWLSPVSTWYVGLLVGHWVSAANIWATVIWTNSSANGDYALALWLTNTADAYGAVSIGNNITNSTQYKVVLWKYNVDYTSGAFEFWYWTAGWDLNLLTIFQDWSTRLTAKDQAGNVYLTWLALSGYLTWGSLSWYITGLALSGYLTWYTESDPVRLAASGNYCLLSWWAYYGPAYDASGNAYSTGAWLTGSYVSIADSWVYFEANSGGYYNLNPLGYITWGALTWVTSDWSTGWLLCLFSWDGSIYGNSSYYMTDQYWLIHYAAKQTGAAAYFYNYYAWTSNYNAYAITTFVKNATAEWIERQTFVLWADLISPLVKIMNSTTSANSGGFADNSIVLDVRQSAFGWGNIIQASKNGTPKFYVDSTGDTYGNMYDLSGNAYSTGVGGLTGDYLPLAGNTTGTAISGEIHIESSENIFFDTNDWVYSYIWLGWWWGNSIDLIKDSETWDNSYIGINDLYVPHLSYWAIWMPATQVFLDSSWLQYYDDYSGSYTDRSLVDKGYVTSLGYITWGSLTWVTSDWSTGQQLCIFTGDGSIYGNSNYYYSPQYGLLHITYVGTGASAYFYNYYTGSVDNNNYAQVNLVHGATAAQFQRTTNSQEKDYVNPLVDILNSTNTSWSGWYSDSAPLLSVRQSSFGTGNIIQALKNSVAKFRVDGVGDTYLSGNFYPQRIVKRVSVAWSASTLTPAGEQDIYQLTWLATGLTLVNSTSIYDGEQIKIRITDDGTGQTLTRGTGYVAKGGIALPSMTTTGKVMVFGFEWFANLGARNLLALSIEA